MRLAKAIIDSKAAATTTAAATGSSSVAHLFGFIPDDIGKFGVTMGVVLSATLIVSHIRKTVIEYRKGILEIEKLREEIKQARRKDV